MRPILVALLSIITAAVSLLPVEEVAAQTPQTTDYRVTLTNLTSTQPFSPPLLVTHSTGVQVFQVGASASEGVRLIAEDGDNSVLERNLRGRRGVFEVVAGADPIHRSGGPGSNSATFRIRGSTEATRLSVVTMLICTNDAFTGVSSFQLPTGSTPASVRSNAYDAGTEENNQIYRHIVDPCGAIGPVSAPADGMNLRLATSGSISLHTGIGIGTGELTRAHAWTDPVIEIRVERAEAATVGVVSPPRTGDGGLVDTHAPVGPAANAYILLPLLIAAATLPMTLLMLRRRRAER